MGVDRNPGFSTLALHSGNGAADADPATMLEERVAALEGGTAAVAVASGLAAQLATLLVLLRPGDELITSDRIGAQPAAQIRSASAAFGWQVRWADLDEPSSFESAVSPRTKAMLAATLADDGAIVTDLAALAQIAKRAQVPLVVDNTLATPYLARPLEHGADIVICAAEPFLGGAGSPDLGIVVDGGRFNWMREKRYPAFHEPHADGASLGDTFGNFAFAVACRGVAGGNLGALPASEAAKACLGGVETLAMRVQRHSDSALAVAEYLAVHRGIEWVSYPGLRGGRHYNLARKYCPNGAGAVVSFGLVGGAQGAGRLAEQTSLIAKSDRLGGARSVFVDRQENGTGPSSSSGRLCLSVGLEEVGDLLADLEQALEE